MADLETEVELLKSKVSDMEKLHVRLDDAIGKISEVSNCINRMLAVHEEKLSQQEEAVFAAEELIEQRRTEFSNEIKELHSRIVLIVCWPCMRKNSHNKKRQFLQLKSL